MTAAFRPGRRKVWTVRRSISASAGPSAAPRSTTRSPRSRPTPTAAPGPGWPGPTADVALWAGPGYRWLQAFTGDLLGPDARRRAVAIEPMSCPPNAFVSGTDVLTLQPGDSVIHRWGIMAAVS